MGRFRPVRKAQQRLVNISGASNGHSEVSMEEDNPHPEDYGKFIEAYIYVYLYIQ